MREKHVSVAEKIAYCQGKIKDFESRLEEYERRPTLFGRDIPVVRSNKKMFEDCLRTLVKIRGEEVVTLEELCCLVRHEEFQLFESYSKVLASDEASVAEEKSSLGDEDFDSSSISEPPTRPNTPTSPSGY